MSMGAERAEAQPDEGPAFAIRRDGSVHYDDFIGAPDEPEPFAEPAAEARPPRSLGKTLLAVLLILLTLGWLGAAGWAIRESGVAPTLQAMVSWIATLSVPLILLAIVWTMFGRTSRRESERFTRAVAEMRRESAALEGVLAVVASRLDENEARLTDEAARLMSLGDEASDRLGRVTHYLARQSAELDRRSHALEAAAENARVDIGVLLHDLPRAEEQARAVAAAMRDAGLGAHEQAGALEGQLAALAARGREADETVGGAAQRLGAHVARIESSAGSASERIEQASGALGATVDAALARASEAVEATRAGLETQSQAMLAGIEQSRAAFEEAGAEASRRLGERLELVGGRLEALAATLAAQDAASHALVTGLSRELGELETRFAELDRSGGESHQRLSSSMEAVRGSVERLHTELGEGEAHAGALSARTREINEALDGLSTQLRIEIPDALGKIETQAGSTRAAAESIAPSVEAARALAENVYAAGSRLEALSGALAGQEQASRALLEGVARELEALDGRFAQLRETGEFNAGRLTGAMGEVGAALTALHAEVREGHEATGLSVERTQALAQTIAAISAQLTGDVPAALNAVEEHAARTGDAARAILPAVETVQAAAGAAAASLAEGEGSVRRQQEELGALLATIAESVARTEEHVRSLGAFAGEADSEAQRLISGTAPELIDALVRVREAANQAANHAREAIGAVIPESLAALSEASRDAISEAVTEPVQEKLSQLGVMSDAAVAAARRASERLTRQLVTMGETAAAIEARIDDERRDREEKDAESLSRRVALLIESLNSTAIDVTKILSNDVTDTAWAAYLKGDRGVFTRRAVRLLDSGEAREILRHYEEEPEFREQVNRYIHDFEGMLRRVLADRDGSPLSIALLSSDMGKLYVALAQAIERLRS
ncbi:MAG TPA: hypothetical protein VEW25_12985 [Allosphingosinicella sp.]|nr:hypothetical protein [Allosphingosinicella sp.]